MDPAAFREALAPLLTALANADPADPALAERLEQGWPLHGSTLQELARATREGVDGGWLAPRTRDGIRFGRVCAAHDGFGLTVDCVRMAGAGPGHVHPRGEIDLSFAVEGDPRFDGERPGWTVYAPGSWHRPTVSDGTMDILYFLPGGSIVFDRAGA